MIGKIIVLLFLFIGIKYISKFKEEPVRQLMLSLDNNDSIFLDDNLKVFSISNKFGSVYCKYNDLIDFELKDDEQTIIKGSEMQMSVGASGFEIPRVVIRAVDKHKIKTTTTRYFLEFF